METSFGQGGSRTNHGTRRVRTGVFARQPQSRQNHAQVVASVLLNETNVRVSTHSSKNAHRQLVQPFIRKPFFGHRFFNQSSRSR